MLQPGIVPRAQEKHKTKHKATVVNWHSHLVPSGRETSSAYAVRSKRHRASMLQERGITPWKIGLLLLRAVSWPVCKKIRVGYENIKQGV